MQALTSPNPWTWYNNNNKTTIGETMITNKVEALRLFTVIQAARLEQKGLRRRGRTAHSILGDYGFKGCRQKRIDSALRFYYEATREPGEELAK